MLALARSARSSDSAAARSVTSRRLLARPQAVTGSGKIVAPLAGEPRHHAAASEDDCLACAQRLAEAVGLIESHPDAHANLAAAGAYTARRYHAAAFEARLLRFWREF